MVVVIFGVSGAGKTTLSKLLARELGWAFYEADNLHSPGNVEKMHASIPLTDEDRWPWLESLRELVKRSLAAGENAILACSALKKTYRDCLQVGADVRFVYLRGGYELIANQLRHRRGHFMNPALLQSQFTDLEEPRPAEGAIVIELGSSPDELVEEIKTQLRLVPAHRQLRRQR